MARLIGRPMKYHLIIFQLDPNTLYTPATISRFAHREGFLFKNLCDEEKKRHLQRIRIAMGRFADNHQFPPMGDGFVKLHGQAPTPAWYGWRWREAAAERTQDHTPTEVPS